MNLIFQPKSNRLDHYLSFLFIYSNNHCFCLYTRIISGINLVSPPILEKLDLIEYSLSKFHSAPEDFDQSITIYF